MSSISEINEVARQPKPDKKRLKKMFSWTDDGT